MNENGTTAYVATGKFSIRIFYQNQLPDFFCYLLFLEIDIGNKIEDQTFHADRPFLFYIEDETTGTIIYVGKIMNPLDKSTNAESSNQQHSPSKFGPPVPEAGQSFVILLNPENHQAQV